MAAYRVLTDGKVSLCVRLSPENYVSMPKKQRSGFCSLSRNPVPFLPFAGTFFLKEGNTCNFPEFSPF
jgi:hypothetical protein